ncbi:MAG: DUF3021 domain-containing protein [Clostridia bacterium]|nr:DUF3021 domain-containing protein [Clostridia bacterium]
MNKYVKEFFHRGLIFAGFGPIVLGIIYCILSYTVRGFTLTGGETFVAIVSIYLLAFLQAGATVFNQIESWPVPKSLLCHFGVLYVAYVTCYLVNTWIPFNWSVILIFTAIFVLTFFVIWFIVYAIVKSTEKKLNRKI